MVAAVKYESIEEEFGEIAILRPLMVEDLAQFPDDGHRFEIIGGQLFVSPSPSYSHQTILVQLVTWLNLHLIQTGVGQTLAAPMDVYLSLYDVVQPDILVVLDERAELIREDGIHGAPNLVVEILSPSSLVGDYVRKAALYAQHGVQEYWIVNPATSTVHLQSLQDDRFVLVNDFGRDDILISPLLDGFELDLATVFPEPVATDEETDDPASSSGDAEVEDER